MEIHIAMKFIICMFFFVSIPIFAQEFTTDEASKIAKQIQNDQKKLFECELSNEDIIDATRFDLKQKNISVSTFSDIANKTRTLVDALKQFVIQGNKADKVFSEMKLERHGITSENWKYYTCNYNTEKKIAALEAMIPDSEAKIIEQFPKSLQPLLENWLLETKILQDFDNKKPDKRELPRSQKLYSWWQNALKKYDLKQDDSELIIQILAKESPLPPRDQQYWHTYFAQKLKICRDLAAPPLRIEETKVSEQNAAKHIAFEGYVKKMRTQILSTESVQNISVITLGYDIPMFASRGDRIWEARVMTIEQELRAIIWINPKTKAVHFVCGPYFAEEKQNE
jgi:hypothetical protein